MKQISKPNFIKKIYTDIHTCPACGTKFQLEEGIDNLKIKSETADAVDPYFIDEITRGNTDCLAINLDDDNKKRLVEDMRFISEKFQEYEKFNVYFPNQYVTYLSCKIKCPTCGREIIKTTTIYGGNVLVGCYKVSYREANGVDIAYFKSYGYVWCIIALGEDCKEDREVLEKLNYV